MNVNIVVQVRAARHNMQFSIERLSSCQIEIFDSFLLLSLFAMKKFLPVVIMIIRYPDEGAQFQFQRKEY